MLQLEYQEAMISKNSECLNKVLNIVKDKPLLLDIDMDFYSCQNPFMDLLGDKFEFCHEVFKFKEQSTLKSTLEFRKVQLDTLKIICDGEKLNNIPSNIFTKTISKPGNLDQLFLEMKSLIKNDDYITDLYYVGQQTELPHHISTKDEITILLNECQKLFRSLSPIMITCARSVYDEYSPPGQVEWVQEMLVNRLRDCFKVKLSLEYDVK